VLRRLRDWRAERKRRRLEKYADQLGFMDRDELDRLRKQQSPVRGGFRRRV
jgi:hypothetical protein